MYLSHQHRAYAIGALVAGIIADLFGAAWAIAAIGALTFISGVVVLLIITAVTTPSRDV